MRVVSRYTWGVLSAAGTGYSVLQLVVTLWRDDSYVTKLAGWEFSPDVVFAFWSALLAFSGAFAFIFLYPLFGRLAGRFYSAHKPKVWRFNDMLPELENLQTILAPTATTNGPMFHSSPSLSAELSVMHDKLMALEIATPRSNWETRLRGQYRSRDHLDSWYQFVSALIVYCREHRYEQAKTLTRDLELA